MTLSRNINRKSLHIIPVKEGVRLKTDLESEPCIRVLYQDGTLLSKHRDNNTTFIRPPSGSKRNDIGHWSHWCQQRNLCKMIGNTLIESMSQLRSQWCDNSFKHLLKIFVTHPFPSECGLICCLCVSSILRSLFSEFRCLVVAKYLWIC